MSNNTDIKEFKTELCVQPKSWFLMIFNFGRSLTRCTWAVSLMLNYMCNSSWPDCGWGDRIHLPVGNEMLVMCWSQSSFFTSKMSTPSSVWTVLGNKQIKLMKSVFWSHLGKYIVVLQIFFSYQAILALERHSPTQSKWNVWNKWSGSEGAQIRPGCRCPASFPALSLNRTEEDEGEWDRTGVHALENLALRGAVVDSTLNAMGGKSDPTCFVLKAEL